MTDKYEYPETMYKIEADRWWSPDLCKDENDDYSDGFWLWHNDPRFGPEPSGPMFAVDYDKDNCVSVGIRATAANYSWPEVNALMDAFYCELPPERMRR